MIRYYSQIEKWPEQPKYGDVVVTEDCAIFLGSFKVKNLIKFRNKKIIRWWVGTDALTMWFFPPGKSKIKILIHRIKSYLLNPLIYEHWFVSERLRNEILTKTNLNIKRSMIVVHEASDIVKLENPFVVGYYMPEETVYNKWVYGYTIIRSVKLYFRKDNIVFLRYNGKDDIRVFLSLIDVYIRPSNHDGTPRLNLLCEKNNIPYTTNQDFDYLINWIKEKI